MSIISEVTDALKLVSETIKNTKEVYDAVNDGYQYFNKKYPEIKTDVVEMCNELWKSCNAVAVAAGIVTNFKFNGTPQALPNEPSRFNEHYMNYISNNNEARNLIRSLKGSCHKIEMHVRHLEDEAGNKLNSRDFLALFGLHSYAKSNEVKSALQNIYNDEREMYYMVDKLSESITKALNDVNNALAPNGLMHADYVPDAAKLLNDYAKLFGALQTDARNQANALETLVEELNK